MKVSILIPTFNRAELLKESLESAQRQTHEPVEILVSDNGSTDRTREFVEGVARADTRVRLLPARPSADMFANFNYLVEQSRGDAFCLLADDDRLLPEYVASLARPLVDDPVLVATFCDHWIVSAQGTRLVKDSDDNSRQYGRSILPSGIVADPLAVALRQTMSIVFALYRASVFRQQLFDLTCGGAADVDYTIRAARLGPLYYVAERLGEYRVHGSTATATRTSFMLDGAIATYNKHAFDSPSHEALRVERLRRLYRLKAVMASTRNRGEWWRSVRMYQRYGGSLVQPDILLSCALALLPHGPAEALKNRAKAARAGR